ncbi:MAG: hypothetical protein MRJ96_11455 [Nitrospirales bacterium]|nr:hypothetical protein [Nitrospira sp.]MDR4502055.1 hypothetical protein [Nitrospirales bacterium]
MADQRARHQSEVAEWDANTKAAIVVQGLKGKSAVAWCTEHQTSQAQYYPWRDQLQTHASLAFEGHQRSQQEAGRQQELLDSTRWWANCPESQKKRRGP